MLRQPSEKNRTLSRTIEIPIILFFIGTIVFIGFFLLRTYVLMESYAREKDSETIQAAVNVFEEDMESINRISKLITADTTVRNFLKGTTERQKTKITEVLNNYVNLHDYIASIYISAEDGEYGYGRSEWDLVNVRTDILASKKWQKRLSSKLGRVVIGADGWGAFVHDSSYPYISFSRAVYDLDSQKLIGYLVINVKPELWQQIFSVAIESSEQGVLVTNSSGEQFYRNNFPDSIIDNAGLTEENSTRKIYLEDDAYNIFLVKPEKTDMNVYFRDGRTALSGMGVQIYLFIGCYFVLVLFCLAVFHRLLRIRVIIPIDRLVSSMHEVEDGWFRKVKMKTQHNEIGVLTESYNSMMTEIYELMGKTEKQEKEKYQLELSLLQEQINPHFLYNTLYTIGYMAAENDDMQVYDAVQTLGTFYRRFLSKGSKEITVSQEIKIIEDYLKLQKLRFGELYETEIAVADDVRNEPVLRLILQPLVENCIYHGVRPKGECCLISVSAERQDDRLLFKVKDTGVGMTDEEIDRVFNGPEEDIEHKSFGMKATIKRIQLYYGTEDVYEIHSEVGEYTEIILKLPMLGRSANETNQSNVS